MCPSLSNRSNSGINMLLFFFIIDCSAARCVGLYRSGTTLHHPTPLYTILYHPTPSYTTLYHPIPSYTILHHPTPSYTTLYHPTPLYTILYHPTPLYTPLHHPPLGNFRCLRIRQTRQMIALHMRNHMLDSLIHAVCHLLFHFQPRCRREHIRVCLW